MLIITAIVFMLLGFAIFTFTFYSVEYGTHKDMNTSFYPNSKFITFKEFLIRVKSENHKWERANEFPTSIFASHSEIHADGIKFNEVYFMFNFKNYVKFFIWKKRNLKKFPLISMNLMRKSIR